MIQNFFDVKTVFLRREFEVHYPSSTWRSVTFNSWLVRFTAHWKDYGRFKLIVNPKFIWFFLKFYLDSHISRFGFAQLGLGIFVRQLMQIENAYLYKGMQKVRKWALFWRLKFYLNFEKNSWISISNLFPLRKMIAISGFVILIVDS